MPINLDLLIAAPMLQDSLVDKDGTPMAGGTITCFQDDSRTTLKNWYYQSSNFADASGKYSFSQLPNPLTLSAAGTICDINGVDTIPFFYPYDETDQTKSQPYYITIVNHAQTNQITRPNFPYNRDETSPEITENSINNLIINNGFWRNGQPNYINQTPFNSIVLSTGGMSTIMTSMPLNVWTGITTLFGAVVSPSQHDGFSMPDVQFLKDNLTGNDTLTFTPFPASTALLIDNNTTPEYYINHVCSGAGSAETVKCYQFPIAFHLNNLCNFNFTVSIQAQNAGGTAPGQNVISLNLLQFTGSGSSSPAPIIIGGTSITLTNEWGVYTATGTFPSLVGLPISNTEDDAWYLQIEMPLNTVCNINFTKPSLYLTENIIPNNDFFTYDQIDSVINSPRTGDIRTSLNSFSPYGWVPANDGTIGNALSGGTTRHNSDTWPLYSLLWNGVSNTYAPVSSGRGASAYADFIANKTITLTKTLSRFIGEAGAGAGLTTYALGQTAGAEATAVSLINANMAAHTHGAGSPNINFIGGQSPGTFTIPGGAGGSGISTTTDTGTGLNSSGAPFNVAIIPPSVFYNVFFKL